MCNNCICGNTHLHLKEPLAPPTDAKKAALGSITKSPVMPATKGFQQKGKKVDELATAYRRFDFELKKEIDLIFQNHLREKNPKNSKSSVSKLLNPAKFARVLNCQTIPLSYFQNKDELTDDLLPRLEYYANDDGGRARFGGMAVCSNTWICPYCSMRYLQQQAKKLDMWHNFLSSKGGDMYMLTLTAPHYAYQSLQEVQTALIKSKTRLFADKGWREEMKRLGVDVGMNVASTEDPYGENGWHTHYHIIFYRQKLIGEVLKPINIKEIENITHKVWSRVVVRSGLNAPSREHGVKMSSAKDAAKYICKLSKEGSGEAFVSNSSNWMLAKELAGERFKSASKASRTFFDLVATAALLRDNNSPEAIAEREKCHRLCREYADAKKGKTRIVYSDALLNAMEASGFNAEWELLCSTDYQEQEKEKDVQNSSNDGCLEADENKKEALGDCISLIGYFKNTTWHTVINRRGGTIKENVKGDILDIVEGVIGNKTAAEIIAYSIDASLIKALVNKYLHTLVKKYDLKKRIGLSKDELEECEGIGGFEFYDFFASESDLQFLKDKRQARIDLRHAKLKSIPLKKGQPIVLSNQKSEPQRTLSDYLMTKDDYIDGIPKMFL